MATWKNYTATLGANVANAANFTVPYQSGDTSATFTLSRPSQVVVGQAVYNTPSQATLAYAGSITVTNLSGQTWLAGTVVTFNPQLAVPTGNAGFLSPVPAPTNLTDNSGGTASATIAAITDVPTANAVASVNKALNDTKTALKAAGVLT